MGIPDPFAMRLQAYTLACRALLSHYADLHRATLAHPKLTCESCIAQFDNALHAYFLGDASNDSSDAAEQLGGRLQAEADSFRRRNLPAAEVFDAVIADVKGGASAWDYKRELQTLHVQGRDMALNYFKNSPAPITQRRLETECGLGHEYISSKTKNVPMSYQTAECRITIRFAPDYGFKDYLALPYQFLHEYTAHVYAADNDRSPLFHDGWMMYAAQAFFKESDNLHPAQANIFLEYLYPQLNSDARIFTGFAQDLDAWLGRSEEGTSSGTFRRITYELAAFEPQFPQPANWINTFLLALYQEFASYENRAELIKVVHNYSVEELGRYLWRRPHVISYFSRYQPDVEEL